MSTYDPGAPVPADAAPPELIPAGDMLRGAREAAGLSIAEVAQQLKLAPKQVIALEEGDFNNLPGRTFVRGFARNYARLLQLDQQAVIDALPGAAAGGGLDSPALHATTVSIGELPSEARARAAWFGWLLLVVIIVGAVYAGWQYLQGRSTPASTATPARPSSGSSAPAAATPTSAGTIALPGPGHDATASGANMEPPAPNAATGPAEATPLGFTVRGSSWIEVRDATGKLVMSRTLAGGQSESIGGVQPFEVVLGNAGDVAVTFNGQPVDIAPLPRANVARFKLP